MKWILCLRSCEGENRSNLKQLFTLLSDSVKAPIFVILENQVNLFG